MARGPLLRILVLMAAALRLAGAFLAGAPAVILAQQPAPAWPRLPLVSSRVGTRLSCANIRARSDRCGDGKQSGKQSAAERRDFATHLVSSLIAGAADERFSGAVSLWLEGPLATPQERRALTG